jgi:carbon monoxide dehydrogenase subunit G
VARSPYVIEYRGDFSLPRPPDEVWSAMQRFDRYERWWGWLKDFRVEGTGLETGSVLHGVVVPPLPFRLSVRIVLAECLRPQSIDADIHGDLEGTARIVLEPERKGTRANVSSSIEVMQRPIRLAARVAPRALRWGHDRVVEATVTSFRQHLTDLTGGVDH